MGPSSPAEEHRPDNDYPPKAIVSSSFIPAFSRNVTHHQNDCTLLPDHVQEDLRHRLTCRSRRCDRCPVIVILNREEQTQDEEPAEDRRDDANWSRHVRIVSLLGHLRARIKLDNPEDQLVEGGHPSAMHASDLSVCTEPEESR
jgi:ferredoxin